MFERFYPDEDYRSVFEIPYKDLMERGINALIFDVDNTLAPYDVKRPPVKISALFSRLTKMGFQICLLSNNGSKRLNVFNERLKLYVVCRAMKPLTGGVKKAMGLMNSKPENTAIIGDQIFTDILCGNLVGLTTILVNPVSEKDQLTVRMKRGPEMFVIGKYRKRQIKDE